MFPAVASFTDAWIETPSRTAAYFAIKSHLLQMRGLKPPTEEEVMLIQVASFTDAWIETDKRLLMEYPFKSHLLQMRGLKR